MPRYPRGPSDAGDLCGSARSVVRRRSRRPPRSGRRRGRRAPTRPTRRLTARSAFRQPDGPEVEAAGSVDQDCDVEVALLDRVADVRFAGPGKDRPVHPADVIARLVGSCLSWLDTVAEHERGVTAVSAADRPCGPPPARRGGAVPAGQDRHAVRRSPRDWWIARQDDRRRLGGHAPGRADGRDRSRHRLPSLGLRRRVDVDHGVGGGRRHLRRICRCLDSGRCRDRRRRQARAVANWSNRAPEPS